MFDGNKYQETEKVSSGFLKDCHVSQYLSSYPSTLHTHKDTQFAASCQGVLSGEKAMSKVHLISYASASCYDQMSLPRHFSQLLRGWQSTFILATFLTIWLLCWLTPISYAQDDDSTTEPFITVESTLSGTDIIIVTINYDINSIENVDKLEIFYHIPPGTDVLETTPKSHGDSQDDGGKPRKFWRYDQPNSEQSLGEIKVSLHIKDSGNLNRVDHRAVLVINDDVNDDHRVATDVTYLNGETESPTNTPSPTPTNVPPTPSVTIVEMTINDTTIPDAGLRPGDKFSLTVNYDNTGEVSVDELEIDFEFPNGVTLIADESEDEYIGELDMGGGGARKFQFQLIQNEFDDSTNMSIQVRLKTGNMVLAEKTIEFSIYVPQESDFKVIEQRVEGTENAGVAKLIFRFRNNGSDIPGTRVVLRSASLADNTLIILNSTLDFEPIEHEPQSEPEGAFWHIGHLDWRDGERVLEVFVRVNPSFHSNLTASFSFVAPKPGLLTSFPFSPAEIDILSRVGQENGDIIPLATATMMPPATATMIPPATATLTPTAPGGTIGTSPEHGGFAGGAPVITPEPPPPEGQSFWERIKQRDTQAWLLLLGAITGTVLFVGGGGWYLLQAKRDSNGDEPMMTSMAKLVDSHGRSFPIHLPRFTIGRAEENQLTIDESFTGWQTISRHHAVIIHDEDGRYIIEDKGSENGIKVNGRPTQKNLLKHNWHVTIGSERFTFQDYIN